MALLIHKVLIIGRDIKLAHSIFALPFALLGGFLAARYMGLRYTPTHIILIVLCMIFARTFAMLANRYFDRQIDAANPRTAGRALPSGRIQPRDVRYAMALNLLALEVCAAGFGFAFDNWFPLIASPLVVIWLGAYPLFKRFTLGAHFSLGLALALSPLAAALAVAPVYLAHSPVAWLLAGFVLLWVAGFDIIYALQDIDVDRRDKLHSVPAKLGPTGALITAKAIHLVGLGLLVVMQRLQPAFRENQIIPAMQMSFFSLGLILVAILLIIEHQAASRGRFTMAFFVANGLISIALCALAAADLLTYGA